MFFHFPLAARGGGRAAAGASGDGGGCSGRRRAPEVAAGQQGGRRRAPAAAAGANDGSRPAGRQAAGASGIICFVYVFLLFRFSFFPDLCLIFRLFWTSRFFVCFLIVRVLLIFRFLL